MPPVPAQHAAIAAFTEESYREADAAVAAFGDARAIVLDAIDDLGWTGVAPADGAFYVYAGIAGQLGPYPDSEAWCEALLEQHGVALTPGTDFDQRDGGSAVRLSWPRAPKRWRLPSFASCASSNRIRVGHWVLSLSHGADAVASTGSARRGAKR